MLLNPYRFSLPSAVVVSVERQNDYSYVSEGESAIFVVTLSNANGATAVPYALAAATQVDFYKTLPGDKHYSNPNAICIANVPGAVGAQEVGPYTYCVDEYGNNTATLSIESFYPNDGASTLDWASVTFSDGVTADSGLLTIPVGVTTFTVTVSVATDALVEGTEGFYLSVGGVDRPSFGYYINNVPVPPTSATEDPFYENVSLHLTFEDDGYSQPRDSGRHLHEPLENLYFAPNLVTKKFGFSSAQFTNLTVLRYPAHPSWTLTSTDFTIELYANVTSYSSLGVFFLQCESSGFEFYSTSSGQIFFNANSSTTLVASPSGTFTLNSFKHLAVTRSGNVYRLFLDGNLVGTNTSAGSPAFGSGILRVGSYVSAGYALIGFLDDIKITKGIARYSANFTVPTESTTAYYGEDPHYDKVVLLISGINHTSYLGAVDASWLSRPLTIGGSAFIESSSPTFGNSALVLNGTTNYLASLTPSNHAFTYNLLADFTLEFFARKLEDNATGNDIVLTTKSAGNATDGYEVALNLTEGFVFKGLNAASTAITNVAVAAVPDLHSGVRKHYAVVRSGENLTLFIDGAVVATATVVTTRNFTAAALVIGADPSKTTNFFKGKLDGLRLTKGVARYTSAFTPPTSRFPVKAPAPVVDPLFQNLALYLNGRNTRYQPTYDTIASSTFSDSGPLNVPVARRSTGSIRLSTNYTKVNRTSVAVLNQDVIVGQHAAIAFGLSDFCIECFVLWTQDPSGPQLGVFQVGCSTANFEASNANFSLLSFGGKYALYLNGYQPVSSTEATIATFTWQHVALTRQSGTLRLFVNGLLAYEAPNTFNQTDPGFVVGGYYSAAYQGNAYVDNFAITVGHYRYSGPFTPPTRPYTRSLSSVAGGPSLLLLHFSGLDTSTSFVDSSANVNLLTVSGAAEIDSSSFAFSPTSGYFLGGRLNVSPTTNFAFGSNEFTVEGFFKLDATHTYGMPWCVGTYGVSNGFYGGFNKISASVIRIIFGVLSPNAFTPVTVDLPIQPFLDGFVHVAWIRENASGGQIAKIYVNGMLAGQSTLNQDGINQVTGVPNTVFIGAMNNLGSATSFGKFNYIGWIDELRMVKGSAVYSANFVPPRGAFDSGSVVPTPYSNVVLDLRLNGTDGATTFTDSSTYSRSVTAVGNAQVDTAYHYGGGGSLLLDGSGDYLTVPTSTDFNLGVTYLCEASVRPTSLASNFGILHRGFYNTTTNTWANFSFSWRWFGGASQFLRIYFYATTNTDEQFVDIPAALRVNEWTHIAVHRTGTTAKVFIDGSERGSISGLNTPAPSVASLLIGRWAYSAGNEDFTGHLDNIRISKP